MGIIAVALGLCRLRLWQAVLSLLALDTFNVVIDVYGQALAPVRIGLIWALGLAVYVAWYGLGWGARRLWAARSRRA